MKSLSITFVFVMSYTRKINCSVKLNFCEDMQYIN